MSDNKAECDCSTCHYGAAGHIYGNYVCCYFGSKECDYIPKENVFQPSDKAADAAGDES